MSLGPDPIVEQVVANVAQVSDTDALELPPLYDAVDPEALETLVATLGHGEVSFDYAGYSVTVDSSGSVSLDALARDRVVPEPVVGD